VPAERQWDPDLDGLRVEGGRIMAVKCGVEDADTKAGETYFKLISAAFIDEVEAQGSHLVYVDVLDESGRRLNGQVVEHGWPWDKYPQFDEVVTDTVSGEHLAQWGLFAGYDANRVEYGPYWVRVRGKSDVFYGMGLPWNRHVAFVVVFQRVTASVTPDPTPPPAPPAPDPTPPPAPEPPSGSIAAEIRNAAWVALYPKGGVRYNPGAALARVARDRKLGVPVTQELDYKAYRFQGFAGGVVYALTGRWDQIEFVSW